MRIVKALLLLVSLAPTTTLADPVQFLHDAPQLSSLPYPGQGLRLEFQLLNTREVVHDVRVHAVIDGRLVDTLAKPGFLNEADRPTYSVEFHSPIDSLSYQAFLIGERGVILTSPNYSVRRTCNPLEKSVEESTPSGNGVAERLQAMEFAARRLEREIETYNRAFALLEDLQAHMKSK